MSTAAAVPSQRLTIEVNGEALGTHTVTQRAKLECDIPPQVAARSDRLNILFRHPDAATPSVLDGTSDTRLLAFAFQRCRLFMDTAAVPPLAPDHLVPPRELLFDGTTTPEDLNALARASSASG